MAIDPAILRAMATAGASMEVILAAVEAAKAADDAVLAERRAKAAAKKARQRAAKKPPVAAPDLELSPIVPGTEGDIEGQSGTLGDQQKKAPPDPLKENTGSPPSAPKGASDPAGVLPSKGTRLPADWAPKQSHYDNAAAKGFPARWVDGQADAMREWADANGNRPIARKASWDRTFDGWMRREMAKPPSRMNGHHAPRDGFGAVADLLEGVDRDDDDARPFDANDWTAGSAFSGPRHPHAPAGERPGARRGGEVVDGIDYRALN